MRKPPYPPPVQIKLPQLILCCLAPIPSSSTSRHNIAKHAVVGWWTSSNEGEVHTGQLGSISRLGSYSLVSVDWILCERKNGMEGISSFPLSLSLCLFLSANIIIIVIHHRVSRNSNVVNETNTSHGRTDWPAVHMMIKKETAGKTVYFTFPSIVL